MFSLPIDNKLVSRRHQRRVEGDPAGASDLPHDWADGPPPVGLQGHEGDQRDDEAGAC